jgi:hypothetical protein
VSYEVELGESVVNFRSGRITGTVRVVEEDGTMAQFQDLSRGVGEEVYPAPVDGDDLPCDERGLVGREEGRDPSCQVSHGVSIASVPDIALVTGEVLSGTDKFYLSFLGGLWP